MPFKQTISFTFKFWIFIEMAANSDVAGVVEEGRMIPLHIILILLKFRK